MSVSSWLTVTVSTHLDAFSLFSALSRAGWNPIVHQEIVILPLSDGDNFAWKSISEQDIELAFAEIREKGKRNEVIGIVMAYRDSNCGGNFHFYTNGSIGISLSVNRKTIVGLDRVTAIEWYIQVLHDTFSECGISITNICWEEVY